MSVTTPARDGEVNEYNPARSTVTAPRVHFVNGTQTTGRDHARTAAYLSLLIERPVWGVYNRTAGVNAFGFLRDFGQCVLDFLQNATARVGSPANRDRPPRIPDA